MIEKKVRPVAPVYLFGACWVLCGLIFPLYKLWGLLVTAALAAGVYVAASRLMPAKIVQVEAPEKPFNTGEKELDAVLNQGRHDLRQLRELNQAIKDPMLSIQIERMEKAGQAILDEVVKNPAKAREIRRFATYYLPSAVKILTSYAHADASGAKGENTTALKKDVEHNAEVIASAFEKQLDSLFASELLDITTDIDVLEHILKGDGLSK